MNPAFKEHLLGVTGGVECQEVEHIQTLWSGYGKISRYQLRGSSFKTVVVKHIALDRTYGHPRGWNSDQGHARKLRSYEVEMYWYEHWGQRCDVNCRVPKYIGSCSEGNEKWIILEDLNVGHPLRKDQLELPEVKTCLKWLAHFHATFMGEKPNGLWEIGTYWHLDTRPDELEEMEHQELKAKARFIDEALNQCTYRTIVHGDAKPANFCFSEDGREVAAVDFQYVGGGCGMKDVAYFLGSCLSSAECELHETELLDFYFLELRNELDASRSNVDGGALEREWRRMYPFACADFTRFMLGWMPTHQKVNDYNRKMVEQVLAGS